MADPLSISSGLLAVITATIQSSKTLYQTIQSFKNHQRAIGQLLDELKSLGGVLRSLETLVRHDGSTFGPLTFPLTRCCKACTEFEALIVKSQYSAKWQHLYTSCVESWFTVLYALRVALGLLSTSLIARVGKDVTGS